MTTTSADPVSPPREPPGVTDPPRDYPVRLDARLDEPLSRWLWLVKWLLALPHYVVLAFLWLAAAVLSVVAFFAILVTGRYPRAIFEFTVGVMRWSWRVAYYAYGGLGTDRYPPFSLAEEPDYPARLSVDYPERLSRGLVLVKWWLLAIPHYLVLGLLVGGGSWVAWRSGSDLTGNDWQWGSGGLLGILVFIAAVVLLFTGRYPRPLFDIVVGMQRWAFRVCAYAALMTDRYPPFRLDLGGTDPGSENRVEPPSPAGPEHPAAAAVAPLGEPPVAGEAPRPRWTAGYVVTLLVGALVTLAATGLLLGGIGLAAAGAVSRDAGGYLTTPVVSVASQGYAVTSERLELTSSGTASALPSQVLGRLRIRVAPSDGKPLFVGVARTSQVQRYLADVRYDRVVGVSGSQLQYAAHRGGAALGRSPGSVDIWVASASGPGARTLTWDTRAGDWTVVLMNVDGARSVSADVDAGATVPALGWLATGLVVLGLLMLTVGVVLIVVAVRGVTRTGGAGAPAITAPVTTGAPPPVA